MVVSAAVVSPGMWGDYADERRWREREAAEIVGGRWAGRRHFLALLESRWGIGRSDVSVASRPRGLRSRCAFSLSPLQLEDAL